MTEVIVDYEKRWRYCWRCGTPFVSGELIAFVRGHFRWRFGHGSLSHRHFVEWGTMCPRCTTAAELDRAPVRMMCEGCGQPLAIPDGTRRRHWVCSNRCEQRARRRRQTEQRLLVVCDGCGKPFRQARDDARFCSNACRQSAYRRRRATEEPPRAVKRSRSAPDAVHLDDIGGVLHYQGIPIIAIDRLHPGWSGFGNRYVCMFPRGDALIDRSAASKAGLHTGIGDHLFECAHCRRWSVGLAYAWCSRACRLAAHAEQARERRAAGRG